MEVLNINILIIVKQIMKNIQIKQEDIKEEI